MPSPRDIAKQVNDKSQFADGEAGFNVTEGVPSSVDSKERHERDVSVNITNPPEPAPPCTGMHK
jgi:hypothetical protein